MVTRELIKKLQELDPSGEFEVEYLNIERGDYEPIDKVEYQTTPGYIKIE